MRNKIIDLQSSLDKTKIILEDKVQIINSLSEFLKPKIPSVLNLN